MGHYTLSAAAFRKDPPRSFPCPDASASFVTIVQKAPDPFGGGLHLPNMPGGLYHFEPPRTFAACKAKTLGDSGSCRLRDPKKIPMKPHAIWGYASAQQSKRVLVDLDADNMHLAARADEL